MCVHAAETGPVSRKCTVQYPADLRTFASCIAVAGMATHSSKKHKLLGAPAPIDTGAPVFARLPADEHWVENVKLVKAHRDGEIPGVDFKRRVQSDLLGSGLV